MVMEIDGPAGLRAHLGRELGVSPWHEVRQADVDAFAEVTGDRQWIHVDPERARDSRFGGTIVHGYFVLSLGPMLSAQVARFTGFAAGLNYGLERVRFPAPLPVGARVRLRLRLIELTDVPGGVRVTLERTFEREGGDRPVAVALTVSQFMLAGDEA